MNITVRPPDADEEKRKAGCLEQLAVDRQKLLLRWPFIGGIIMRMELCAVRDDRLATACTDGNTIFVDINFYSELSADERLFVLAHEVWHSVLLHFLRRGSRDQGLFNAAADLEIHFILKKEKMREPWVLPHNESWEGLSAEEIYEKLLKTEKYRELFSVSEGSGSGRGERGSGQKEKQFSEGFDRHIYGGENMPQSANDLEQQKNAASGELVFDGDYAPLISEETAERIRSRVVTAAQQMERTCGKLPGYVKELLKNLLQPELPWQELLKQFVTQCFGGKRRWLPPARRHVWQGLYLPSMRDEKIRAVAAVDTSGSTHRDLPQFFGELQGLLKSFGRYELTLIQCDAEIQHVEVYSDTSPMEPSGSWQIHGGGGTDFRPVFDYLKKQPEKPEVLIYLTDGYGNAPPQPPEYPVLWVLTQDGMEPPWGKVISFKGK